MNFSVAMENVLMRKRQVAPGEMFHKAGRPRIIWTVERFNLDARIIHSVLTRIDDPTTKITISADTLSDPQYFCRSDAPRLISS
jgi:hypothetical protein